MVDVVVVDVVVVDVVVVEVVVVESERSELTMRFKRKHFPVRSSPATARTHNGVRLLLDVRQSNPCWHTISLLVSESIWISGTGT